MKSLIVLATLVFSAQTFAEANSATCYGDKAIQNGESKPLKADVTLNFEVDFDKKEMTKVLGHVFVQSAYAENEEISIENSYMGFFNMTKVEANPNYKPRRYKGYTQFKNFDAAHTAGQESGMWGDLVLDLKAGAGEFEGRYIFQAGDHMGGTVLLNCKLY